MKWGESRRSLDEIFHFVNWISTIIEVQTWLDNEFANASISLQKTVAKVNKTLFISLLLL